LREKEVFHKMVEFLRKNGYKIVETKLGRRKGADIVAEKCGREMVIEVKGDTKALDVDLGTAIWQVLRYMKDNSKDFALALTPSYEKYVKAVEYPLKKLNVKVFLVSEEVSQLW